MSHDHSLTIIEFSPLTIYHYGPPLTKGPLPSLFYFSLSGNESLMLEPFNQPVSFLNDDECRVFSLDLPGHGPGLETNQAMNFWFDQIDNQQPIIENFIQTCCKSLDFLIKQGYVDEKKVAAAGLSRGAFIATHFAAADPRVKTILGYAPLTQLSALERFKSSNQNSYFEELSLIHLIDKLVDKSLKFHIGNRDHAVNTASCFSFIHALTEAAFANIRRSPQVELTIYPCIGHRGHGTPTEIFRLGVDWLKKHWMHEQAN